MPIQLIPTSVYSMKEIGDMQQQIDQINDKPTLTQMKPCKRCRIHQGLGY